MLTGLRLLLKHGDWPKCVYSNFVEVTGEFVDEGLLERSTVVDPYLTCHIPKTRLVSNRNY